MCNYQTLFHDDGLGYIVRCNECENIQVGYGNMVITFSYEDFSAFRSWLARIEEEQAPELNPALRCIFIPTPCEGVKLLLSKSELFDMINMFDQADVELQSLALLRLFNVE